MLINRYYYRALFDYGILFAPDQERPFLSV